MFSKGQSMATLIKQVYLNLEEYGPNRGRLSGSITFCNQLGEVRVNLDPEKIERIVSVLADDLVSTAKETASLMVSQVLEQASGGMAIGG